MYYEVTFAELEEIEEVTKQPLTRNYPKAVTATAHKLARIFYCLWTKGGEYHDPGVDSYEQQYQKRIRELPDVHRYAIERWRGRL